MKKIFNFKNFIAESKINLSQEQINFLDKVCANKSVWTQDSEGKVNLSGEFDASNMNLSDLLGIEFGEIEGDFDISDNDLKSLKGCPKKVKGSFNCSLNFLNSLKGGPESVSNSYYCSNNNLFNLDFIAQDFSNLFAVGNNLEKLGKLPAEVSGNFYISSNPTLKSLVGAPKIIGLDFDCNSCNLKSLEGSPEKVGYTFNCSKNSIENLQGGPKEVKKVYDCSSNKISSLEGLARGIISLEAENNKIYLLNGISKEEVNSITNYNFVGNLLPADIINYQFEYLKDTGKLEGWLKEFIEKRAKRFSEILNYNENSETFKRIEILNLPEFSHDYPQILALVIPHLRPDGVFGNYLKKNKDKFSDEFLELAGVISDLKDLGF
jgi:hypothetical protein